MCLAIFINPFSTFIPLFQILKHCSLTCDRPSAGCTFTRQLLNNQNRQDHSAQRFPVLIEYDCLGRGYLLFYWVGSPSKADPIQF
ncbi:Mediator of RNA polymerase II transcription subunit [Trichinella pseudospiralis]